MNVARAAHARCTKICNTEFTIPIYCRTKFAKYIDIYIYDTDDDHE